MLKIDSLHISYLSEEFTGSGYPALEQVNNLIRDLSGEMLIDRPDNKSGRESYTTYPIFKSNTDGFVYYDKPNIQNGVYTSDKFFFKVYPFEMDSLNNYNSFSMKFDGELVSAGIFPDIRETLRLQDDHSLGFTYSTPDSGLSLYGGKGLYSDVIQLTNDGLTGEGSFTYISSITNSDQIIFFPDSLYAEALDFTINDINQQGKFPNVNSKESIIKWYPYLDELYAKEGESSFDMFDNEAKLEGNMLLNPDGLTGNGRILLEGAELLSDRYLFSSTEIVADTADFFLKSLHTEGYTVFTENIFARVDIKNQQGSFESNENYSLVSFPENMYVSYLDRFDWDMQTKELIMGESSDSYMAESIDDESFTGPRYISLDPAQDSLSFISPLAFYDYENNTINANHVRYIDVADVRIYPRDELITVNPDNYIETLENAVIIANRETRNHQFYHASVNITGNNSYTAEADYDYTDELNQVQTIHFTNILSNNQGKTTGMGVIAEEENFRLNPNYHFQGKFSIEAEKEFLLFDGGILIAHGCSNLVNRWLYFSAEIDPLDIYIPVSESPVDIERNNIYAGLYMFYDSVHIYPAFLSARKNYSDQSIVTATGYLYYDKSTGEYLIAEKEKLKDRSLPGNLISLHHEQCILYGEGNLNMGADLGQVQLITYGSIQHNINTNETSTEVLLGIDFYIDDQVMQIMAGEIDSIPGLNNTETQSETYTKSMTGLLGRESYEAFQTELGLFGTVRQLPENFQHTLLLSELKLNWDNVANSWLSSGDIGIEGINNKRVSKRISGLFELQVRRSGNIWDIYVESDRRTWYYFGYTRGVMQVHSSNNVFLDRMKDLKQRNRRLKVKGGESYIYMVSTDAKRNTFYRRYTDLIEAQNF